MKDTLRAFISHFEELLCALLLIIMVMISSANIVARYLPGVSFAASEELVVNLFVWLTLLGSVVAVKQKAHISISLITKKLPAHFQKLCLVIQGISVSIVFLFIVLYGMTETWLEYQAKMATYSLGWPLWVFTLSLPIGSLLFLVRFSQVFLKEWRDF
ncbi:MAG: TRAP transporter small permease [bacterium]